jgi:hypothetical protein
MMETADDLDDLAKRSAEPSGLPRDDYIAAPSGLPRVSTPCGPAKIASDLREEVANAEYQP